MIPVFRIRDGWHNLGNNTSIFQHCIELLEDNNIVVIFPEGSHNLVRRVRPLSKGFTRIVFDFLESNPENELQMLSVGFNYRMATEFRDDVSMHIDNPFPVTFDDSIPRSQQVKVLKAKVHDALARLTTHIPESAYEETVNKLDEMQVDYLDHNAVNACIRNNFQNCPERKGRFLDPIRSVLQIILKIIMIIPYGFWKLYVQPKIVEKEFTATFRFAVAVVLVPFYLLILFLILAIYLSWSLALLVLAGILLFSIITIKL